MSVVGIPFAQAVQEASGVTQRRVSLELLQKSKYKTEHTYPGRSLHGSPKNLPLALRNCRTHPLRNPYNTHTETTGSDNPPWTALPKLRSSQLCTAALKQTGQGKPTACSLFTPRQCLAQRLFAPQCVTQVHWIFECSAEQWGSAPFLTMALGIFWGLPSSSLCYSIAQIWHQGSAGAATCRYTTLLTWRFHPRPQTPLRL